MPMNDEVRKAVALAKSVLIQTGDSGRYPNGEGWGHVSSSYVMQIPTDAWQTIRAELHRLTNDCMAKDAEIARLTAIAEGYDGMVARLHEVTTRLEAANAQLRLMHRVLSQAVCVACADDGVAKDHELDKLDCVLRDQGWITTAVLPSTPTGDNPQGAGDEA